MGEVGEGVKCTLITMSTEKRIELLNHYNHTLEANITLMLNLLETYWKNLILKKMKKQRNKLFMSFVQTTKIYWSFFLFFKLLKRELKYNFALGE